MAISSKPSAILHFFNFILYSTIQITIQYFFKNCSILKYRCASVTQPILVDLIVVLSGGSWA